MKKLLLFLLMFSVSWSFAQINWMSMNQALEAQKKEPKKIVIDFYTDWCGPCKMMEKRTYSHPEIVKYINSNYYAVKFNAEGTENVNYFERIFTNPNFKPKSKGRNALHEFAQFMNISGYPSVVFLDETGRPITSMMGFFSAKDLEPYLHMFASGEYKNIKTRDEWEKYQFKSKIED